MEHGPSAFAPVYPVAAPAPGPGTGIYRPRSGFAFPGPRSDPRGGGLRVAHIRTRRQSLSALSERVVWADAQNGEFSLADVWIFGDHQIHQAMSKFHRSVWWLLAIGIGLRCL